MYLFLNFILPVQEQELLKWENSWVFESAFSAEVKILAARAVCTMVKEIVLLGDYEKPDLGGQNRPSLFPSFLSSTLVILSLVHFKLSSRSKKCSPRKRLSQYITCVSHDIHTHHMIVPMLNIDTCGGYMWFYQAASAERFSWRCSRYSAR